MGSKARLLASAAAREIAHKKSRVDNDKKKRQLEKAQEKARNEQNEADAKKLEKEQSRLKRRKQALIDWGPLQIFPPPAEGEKYGANEDQEKVFFDKLPASLRPHWHNLDIMLGLGRVRSGKSVAAAAQVARVSQIKGARIFVGSINYPHLRDGAMNDIKKLFSRKEDWDFPGIRYKPTTQNKRVEFWNGAVISFINLSETHVDNILSKGADLLWIDEPQLLESSRPLALAITRMSNLSWEYKQIILTGNPDEGLDWAEDWFKLKEMDEDGDNSDVKIGQPCRCQFCVVCEDKDKKEIRYIDGKCPICNYKKKVKCPGNQYFQRVLYFKTRNVHIAENFERDLNAALPYDKVQVFAKGKFIASRQGRIYTCFQGDNIYASNKPIDLNKDLIWALDFNNRPQCSALMQEYRKDKMTHVDVLDEICKYDALVETVTDILIEKLKKIGFKKKILIYGDPSGYNNAVKDLLLDRFHAASLRLEQKGFENQIMVPRTRYPILTRIDSVNWMLRDGNGYSRLHFNECVKQSINSIETTIWNKKGTKEDEAKDDIARKTGRDGDIIRKMTHMGAAIGYFIVQAHPIVPINKKDGGQYLFNQATGKIYQLDPDGKYHETELSKDEIEEEEQFMADVLDEEDDAEDFDESMFEDDDFEYQSSSIARSQTMADALRRGGRQFKIGSR